MLMGAGRLIALLSWVWLFLDRLLGVGIRWRSKHHIETGSQVLEAWSPSLDGDLDPLGGEWWVGLCLCLGYKWGVCFEVPSWDTLIR